MQFEIKGLGLIREYRLLADEAILQVRSDRRRFAPWGLAGGQPGAPTRNTLDPEGTARDLPGKFTMTMRKGDLFRHEQAGGGGHGAPLLRDARVVADDLAEGKVGEAYARSHHGLRDGG